MINHEPSQFKARRALPEGIGGRNVVAAAIPKTAGSRDKVQSTVCGKSTLLAQSGITIQPDSHPFRIGSVRTAEGCGVWWELAAYCILPPRACKVLPAAALSQIQFSREAEERHRAWHGMVWHGTSHASDIICRIPGDWRTGKSWPSVHHTLNHHRRRVRKHCDRPKGHTVATCKMRPLTMLHA